MKKRVAILVFVLAIILAVPSYAAETRGPTIRSALSFDDTKAICSVVVIGDLGTESISATITLKRGTTSLATWHVDDIGELVFINDDITAPKGGTYTLTANVTINNRVYAPVSITETNT